MLSFFKASPVPKVTPQEAAAQLAAGQAVLIDVREADEWAETGVAAPALTLPMSAFKAPSPEWTQALESHKTQRLLLYCHSGGRSQRVAELLHRQGFQTANVGGFADWASAGLPVRKI
jgi:rhodanese-related sulfurtransferase